ncbi:MAG: restriction endonuclease subunit S [Betaproteobacteria bacterium]|nr:restriction endonuclease subunit S [Betaproteobacteria bacterium]
MVRYPQYPSYEQTPCSWLQEVPAHWSFKRLKNVATYNDEALDEHTDPDFEIEYVDISSVSLTKGVESSETFRFEKAPSRARRKVKHGDVIVSTVRTYLKAIAPISTPPDNMIVSTGFAVVRPMDKLYSGYAGYLLQSNGFVGEVAANSVGVSYPAINASDLVRIAALEPPLDEQEAIARFLDFKTAQIDALIAKKEILLERLAEKRTALISHAVTKGLDPSVPMKDSGSEWLGDIPTEWCAKKLKYVGTTRYGLGEPPQKLDGGIPFIRATDIYRGQIDGSQVQTVDPESVPWSRNPALKGKDILVVRSGAYTGDSAIVPTEWAGAIAGYDMVYTAETVLPEYVAFNLLSKHVLNGQIYVAKSRAAQPHLNAEELGAIVIALPPPEVQKRIVDYLEEAMQQIQGHIEKVSLAVERLQEYRSALITNAVTGKIDVRGFRQTASEASAAT